MTLTNLSKSGVEGQVDDEVYRWVSNDKEIRQTAVVELDTATESLIVW